MQPTQPHPPAALLENALRSPFHQRRIGHPAGADLFSIPPLTKSELVADQCLHPHLGSNLTRPTRDYTRLSQTSGTTATPLLVPDSQDNWDWMLENWILGFHSLGITPAERIFFAFSFGPFLGFWTAFEAAIRLGATTYPAGGQSTSARLQNLVRSDASVLCCTPTYALHLAETSQSLHLPPPPNLRQIIVAGEPGGLSLPLRSRLKTLWPDTQLLDHYGMTEVGPTAFLSPSHNDALQILGDRYIAEVVDPASLTPTPPGQTGELLLTPLGRNDWPILRYRTGDLVRAWAPSETGLLRGGILGRADDMVIVRGVNVHPSAIQDVLAAFPDIAEHRMHVLHEGALTELHLEIEPAPTCKHPAALADEIQAALHRSLSLRIRVTATAPDALPRFEMKAKRWIHHQP